MKLIAHRGLMRGPNKHLENKPIQILHCLDLGFDCEIDLWFQNFKFYLGHNSPIYEVDKNFLKKEGLWIHAKNLECLYELSNYKELNYFWHQKDDYTLTSHGYIWTFPGQPLTAKSIAVLPEWSDPTLINNYNCVGICSDFIYHISNRK